MTGERGAKGRGDEQGWTGSSPWSVELEMLGRREVALGVLNMVMSTPEWVHRRVENIQLMTALHFRRRVSVDFTLPSDAPVVPWLRNGSFVLVPVDALAKGPLAGFDLRDEEGRPLPTLTRRQNGHLAWRGLCALAETIVDTTLATELEATLRQVAQGSASEALAIVDRMTSSPSSVQEETLGDYEGFVTAAELLAYNFLLVAVVPSESVGRRILKFAYEESLFQAPSSDGLDTDADRRSSIERVQEALALRPTALSIRVPSFAECESYHFEASVPVGLEIIDVVLRDQARVAAHAALPVGADADEAAVGWTLGYQRVLESSPHLAHLATSRTSDPRAPDEPSQEEFIDPHVSLTLRVERGGWLLASVVASALITAFLFGSYRYVTSWDEPIAGAAPVGTDPAAFTVALLGAVSLAVVRAGEHGFTARLVRGVRAVALGVAGVPILAAWLIVFPGPGRMLELAWLTLSVASLAAFALLAVVRWRPHQ